MALFSLKDNGVSVQHLPKSVCTWDLTFVWTDDINTLLLEKLWMRDIIVIFDSWTFDLMLFGLLYMFYNGLWHSLAMPISLIICAVGKVICQEQGLTLGKPHGHNHSYPGLFSIMIPYWDILDFYYSGHITTAYSIFYGWYKLSKRYPNVGFYRYVSLIIFFVKVPYTWICMMTWLRNHYVLDMTIAPPIAYLATRVAETVSYYPDVCGLGVKAENR